jgi:hypothetical protein
LRSRRRSPATTSTGSISTVRLQQAVSAYRDLSHPDLAAVLAELERLEALQRDLQRTD